MVIPSTVSNLQFCFQDCKLLSKVELKNYGRIWSSFINCDNITEIVIPDGVNSIEYAVTDCDNLRKVTFSRNISNINSSFRQCPFLMDIYYGGTIDEWKTVNVGSLTGATIVHCTDGDIRLENSHPKAG